MMVTKSPITRESTKEAVKPAARGMPERIWRTCGDLLVCFFHFAHKAVGAPCARHSLRPLMSEGKNSRQTSRAMRGEIAKPCFSHGRLFEM
jgi:hypothetical protein